MPPSKTEASKITEDTFKRFIDCRNEGRTNMCDIPTVAILACITEDEAREIISNFSQYSEQWPEIAERP